ncbi:MAG: hypothetical protein NWE95_06550 [Candidatus Bathyarchaeota archaeon]|nr:hypothetical protein [Candidatus Bathyarchaeota archaeon]
MLTSATKRFILPFSGEKTREAWGSKIEAGTVFAVAELERSKGGGLIVKKPEEKLAFIAKMGYPLWLYPKNDAVFIFDGLDDSTFNVSYPEIAPVKAFIESLNRNSTTRESYMRFLSDEAQYFQKRKERTFIFRSLLTDGQFKTELNIYRKEAMEATDQAFATSAPVLLPPTIDEPSISLMLSDFEKVKLFIKEDTQQIPDCIRIVNKATSQYITEIDYQAAAVKEEAEAKIRAQQEIINPKIAAINNEYKRKIKTTTDNFDQELENLQKLKVKTQKSIESNEEKIKQYQRKAKIQAEKNHEIYEKRWKEKIKETKKEIDAFKKELKNIEKNYSNLNKQKISEITRLNLELDAEVKLARQPIVELETARDAKLQVFKQETEKLINLEKPVINGLNENMELLEIITSKFELLGIKDQQLKNSSLFYVPFYSICYEIGLTRRYIILPPSTLGSADFSTKLKAFLGMSKAKGLLSPRFNSIATLISKVERLTKENTAFESQLKDVCERNNLLKNSMFLENASKGLNYLKRGGWLSDKEYDELSQSLPHA